MTKLNCGYVCRTSARTERTMAFKAFKAIAQNANAKGEVKIRRLVNIDEKLARLGEDAAMLFAV